MILQLSVGLLQFRPEAQILRPTLATTGRVPQVLGTVPWMSGPGTNTSLLTAFAKIHRDRAGTKVSQRLHLLVDRASSLLKLFEGVGHRSLSSECYTSIQIMKPKKETVNSHPQICRTPSSENLIDTFPNFLLRYGAYHPSRWGH